MADNIKIVGNITNSTVVSRYSTDDVRLISSQNIQEDFGNNSDYIEYYIYDAGGSLLNTNYNYSDFKSPSTSFVTPSGSLPVIEIDPIIDLQNSGYASGEFKVQYNFFNNLISSPKAELFLKEISEDRTELRVGSTILTNEQIESAAISLINESTGSAYFIDYLINFGFNTQVVAINIILNKVDTGYEILFKLYQPLPSNIQTKTSLWVVKEKINPYSFDINLDKLIIPAPLPQLRGPNFGINIPNHNNVATSYQNYNNLISSVQSISTSSYQQLLSLITSQSIDINTDYTNFSNFSFFGSSRVRLDNFYSKIKQIEDYKSSIAIYTPLTSSRPNLVNDYNLATSSINNIISQFDNFEYYLYFESGSTLTSSIEYSINPYPKSSSTKPYSLYLTGSTLVASWYNFSTSSADNWDNNNQNYIVNTLPSFVKEDSDNTQYITFLNMIGHYFDNIWVYLQAVTDINLANNNLEKGVSKDLVYYVLQSLGTRLYNQYGDSDNTNFLAGQSGNSNFDNDFTQGNYPASASISSASLAPFITPTGSFIINGITIAITGSTLPSNTSSSIYIPSGSSPSLTIDNIITSFNVSKSISPYNSSLQYINISNSGSTGLNFQANSSIAGPIGNSFYVITGSTTIPFTGGSNSYLNAIPRKDLLAESYKRIYHNLPLLMKTKGTAYGLQTLISTFGISNQPYSTSYDAYGSASYFYTTSSAGTGITGSIITVKEYGGDSKLEMLDEFNNDKIRVLSNSITGSVLSPFISLQYQPTSSTQFRTNDLHYIDVSFSPQDKINIFASQSIATYANPTWSLDDFIGDPNYQYSSSYITLDSEKLKYYSPLSASIVPFTGSAGNGLIGATDYNSFIRLIQFFDNSLFKMIKDFIPARANLSTGITINSPVLERNKWVLANPLSTSQIQENDGVVSGPTIKTEYNTLYSNLTESKAAYYTGEITGSGINVYNYFVSGNVNPYLVLTSSLTSADLNEFNHSKFNVILNNVSSSRISLTRQKLEISGSSGMLGKGSHALLTTASLQDSYEFLKTHQLSRYDGVKLFSAKYNDYTDGDTSYGKSAVIDRNSIKLGLFSEIVANKFLPKRNNAVLKYLVDIDGNFTELNQRNTHWQEVQNIFKINNTGSVSLFNDQLYSNQKITNGEKLIFDSGYTYSPLLYFGTGSIDTKAYFENIEDPSSYLITAQNSGSSYFISGSSSNLFPIQSSTGKMFNLFNKEIFDSDNVFTPGSSTATSASYTASDSGDYKLVASFDVSLTIPSGGSGSYTLKLLKNGAAFSPAIENTQDFPISNDATASLYPYTSPQSSHVSVGYTHDDIVYRSGTGSISNKPILLGTTTYSVPTTFYKYYVPLYSTYTVGGFGNCTINNVNFLGSEWYSLVDLGDTITGELAGSCSNIFLYDKFIQLWSIPGFDTPTGTVSESFSINRPQSNPITLAKNDILTLEFSQSYVSVIGGGSNYTASITQGSLEISSLATTTGYSFTSYPYFNSSSLSSSIAIGSGSNTITFNSALSNFNNAGYQFVPNPLSGSTSMLYSISASYGDVDYQFNISPYDMVVTQLSDNSYVESRILSSSISSSFLQIHLDSDMSSLFKNNIMSGSYQRFLLLKKVEDETNVHLSFTKRAGKTSYGFLIPEDINQSILNNIDTITKEAKQKLLNDQSVISGSL